MDVKVERHCVIQYCVYRNLMAIQMVFEMQGAYQNECLNKQAVLQWHKAFLKEHELTEKS